MQHKVKVEVSNAKQRAKKLFNCKVGWDVCRLEYSKVKVEMYSQVTRE